MNHFDRLGFNPQPWIDGEVLKKKFTELSSQSHPDKAAQLDKQSAEKEFQELNASYNILRNSRSRLLHLLELSGAAPAQHIQNVPPAALELFTTIAAAEKRADALVKEKAAASSPMLKVQLMDRSLHEIETIQLIQAGIVERISQIEAGLRETNAAWTPNPPFAALTSLQEAAAALGFLERWRVQLQDRIGQLTF